MIARIWNGVTAADKADQFYDYVKATGVPGLTKTPGNHGVYVLRRLSQGEAHFTVISLWDSLRGIEEFAGDDIARARLYPDDSALLIRFDATVSHYKVLGFHFGAADDAEPSQKGGSG